MTRFIKKCTKHFFRRILNLFNIKNFFFRLFLSFPSTLICIVEFLILFLHYSINQYFTKPNNDNEWPRQLNSTQLYELRTDSR